MDKDPQDPAQYPASAPSDLPRPSTSASNTSPPITDKAPAAVQETPAMPETTDSAQTPKANAPAQKTTFKARMAEKLAVGRRRLGTTWNFAKEAWDEHDLWIEALAVKGGASAIVIAGVVALTSVVALPFFAAAGVIAGCGALVGVGIYGCAAGGAKAWESIRNVYNRVRGREPAEKPKKERRDIVERIAGSKWVKKALEHRWAQQVMNSRAWKTTQRFTKKREDSILHGMAVGGALVTLALGVTVLATQVLVLPVVAIGGLLTWATAEVAVCFASGIYGLYLSAESIMKKRREKKADAAAAMEKPLNLDPVNALPVKPVLEGPAKPVLSETFAAQAQISDKAGNDNMPEKDQVAVPAAAARPPAAKP